MWVPVCSLYNIQDLYKKEINLISENEETEGSEGQAEYMFGDAELDDDDLYSMEHENQTGQSEFRLCVKVLFLNCIHASHSLSQQSII